MKRSKLKRGTFKRSSRKPLRKVSAKRAKRNAKAAPKRANMVEAAGCCDICGSRENLCAHEFVQSDRANAYDNEAVILILCNTGISGEGCHQFVHSQPLVWTFVRCLALLKIRRPHVYNREEACRLEGRHYDESDVDYAEEILRNPKQFEKQMRQYLSAQRRGA